jgi:hypothetical protein
MKKVMTIGTLGIAGAVTAGLLAYPTLGAAAADGADDVAFVRKDDTPDVVLAVDDDDDDDTFARDRDTRTRTNGNTRTRTRTRGTDVSRGDRDHSRGAKVRDWTRDGGDRTRDRSRNQTNDRSRHNTRG